MDREHIQQQAEQLHALIWRKRREIWPGCDMHPINMLDPGAACDLLGIDFQVHDELGSFGSHDSLKVAGRLDRNANTIAVSIQFSEQEVRFTAAHEIGHWLLHQQQVMHRDRPLSRPSEHQQRPPEEREADYFAACFLMPAKLLKQQMTRSLGMAVPLRLNDALAFHLRPDDPEALLRAPANSLIPEKALARCRHFNGRHFRSLAEQFRVTPTAMAIRLRELQLLG